MHKCSNCGQNFNGSFCPNCGKKWAGIKTCPKCGTKTSNANKYCNECGYAFNTLTANNFKNKPEMSAKLKKIYMALKYLPVILFGLFTVLLFAFYATPIAISPAQEFMGEKIPSESYGNVYSILYETSSELSELQNTMLVLIVIAFIAAIFAFIYFFKLYENNIYLSSKSKLPQKLPITYVAFIFYLMLLIIGSVFCGKIAALDEEMGVIVVGACPILLIVFSAAFTILSVLSMLALYLIDKKFKY